MTWAPKARAAALGLLLACSALAQPQVTEPTREASEPAPPAAAARAPDLDPSVPGGAPALEPYPDEGLAWPLIRTLLVLGIVLVSIYLTLNVGLRKLMGVRGMPGGGPSVVEVLDRVALDQKRALFVVKAAGEYLLVGAGEGNVAMITKLDGAEVERLREQKRATPVLSPFLQKLLTRRGGPPNSGTG